MTNSVLPLQQVRQVYYCVLFFEPNSLNTASDITQAEFALMVITVVSLLTGELPLSKTSSKAP